MIATWAADYIGIPFAEFGRNRLGCDCWGLVRLVYADRLGVDLPSYAADYTGTAERDEINRLIGGQMSAWRPVGEPAVGDVVLIRIAGRACHVGVVVGPDTMLHVEKGTDASIAKLTAPAWARRIDGYYRHESQ